MSNSIEKTIQKQKRFLINLRTTIFAVFLLFIAIEVVARVYIENFASEGRFLAYASLKQLQKRSLENIYTPHVYIGHIPTPNYKKGKNRHNSLGYRGSEIVLVKPKGEFRIACLGGSTTYGSHIEDYRFSYPALMEKELIQRGYTNVKVINAGCPMWATWESLVNFQFRVLDLEPDMIIICHAVNDIDSRLVWPPECYRGDNSGARKALVSQIFMASIFEHSTLIRGFMVKMGFIRSHCALTRGVFVWPDTSYGELFNTQKSLKTYPAGIFKKVSAHQMLMTNRPIYFRQNIENITAIARWHDIKTIIATFSYSSQFDDRPRASSEEYILALNEANEILRDIAEKEDVDLFDLANEMPKDKKYYVDGRHVNEDGAELKAKLFAGYIFNSNLIPRP